MIITSRMLRDILGFKGPLTFEGLKKAVKLNGADIEPALQSGLESGMIRSYATYDRHGHAYDVVYSTNWKDNAK